MRRKVIYIKYFTAPNFGDALSPFLLKELTGKEVKDKTLNLATLKDLIKYVVRCLRNNELYGLKLIEMPWTKVVVAIGSILKFSTPNCLVWGSGFMNYGESCSGGRIFAVRGQLSNDRLKELGVIKKNVVLGDPALLLPLVMPSSNTYPKKYKIGIIPHYKETDAFIRNYKGSKIIDLRTKNIQKVIKEILQCEYILSSSLHGLIVSHAYGIPALWIKDQEVIDTDGFKYFDYFSSVGIRKYFPLNIQSIQLNREKDIEEVFDNNKNVSHIQYSLYEVQKKLLSVAPFELCKKYQDFI